MALALLITRIDTLSIGLGGCVAPQYHNNAEKSLEASALNISLKRGDKNSSINSYNI